MNASQLLRKAADTIDERAKERGETQERSMAKTIEMFNSQWGTNLTEQQGWSFMQHLKTSRNLSGHKDDDLIDKIAYMALEAEYVIQNNSDKITIHPTWRHKETHTEYNVVRNNRNIIVLIEKDIEPTNENIFVVSRDELISDYIRTY